EQLHVAEEQHEIDSVRLECIENRLVPNAVVCVRRATDAARWDPHALGELKDDRAGVVADDDAGARGDPTRPTGGDHRLAVAATMRGEKPESQHRLRPMHLLTLRSATLSRPGPAPASTPRLPHDHPVMLP